MTATEVGFEAPSADLTSSLGDILNEASNSIPDAPDEQGATAGAEDIPGGEAPTDAPGPGEPPPDTPPGEGSTGEASPYALTEDGTGYIVPKAELAPMTAFKEYATQAQQLFPTINDAKYAADEQGQWRNFRSDFQVGGDGEIDQVINFLMGGGTDKNDFNTRFQFQNSFVKMAEKIPGVLKSMSDPHRPNFGKEAYEKLATGFIEDRIEQKYREALEQGDINNPEDSLLKEAQQLEWLFKGVYRTNDPELQQKYRVQGIQKPDAKQVNNDQALSQREQAIQKQAKDLEDRSFTDWNRSSLDGPKFNEVRAEIEKLLAPVKDKFTPKMYAAAQRQIFDDTLASIQEDKVFSQNHTSDRRTLESMFRTAWTKGQDTRGLQAHAQTYKNNFIQAAKRYAPSHAKEFLSNATTSVVAQRQPAKPQTPPRTRQAAPQIPAESDPFMDIHDKPAFRNIFKGL